jgi:hypothetical protein
MSARESGPWENHRSTRELQDRHVTLLGWPGTGDDPLLVELAGDRPVFK